MPNASDVAFFAVNNLYAKAGLDVEGVLSGFPTLKAALEKTLSLGNLKNFPDMGLYFTSDPENPSF